VPPQRHRLDAGHPTGPARSHGPGDQAADAADAAHTTGTAAVARDADAYTTVNAATDRDSPIGRRLGAFPQSPVRPTWVIPMPHPAHRSGRSWLGLPGHPMLPRKEVIQPQLPLRLPCYDFVPVSSPALDACLPSSGLARRLQALPPPMT
jgi:hypothetical protein